PQDTLHPLRIAHWQVAFDAFMSAPWFGHGLGSYPQLVAAHAEHSEYLKPFVRTGHIWCHNMPLQLLATTGLFGTSIAAYVAYKITAPLVRALKTHNQAATIGLCALLIHFGTSVTDTPSLHSVRLAAFTILVGFAYGAKQRD
ncbi:MAG: O-antigen ligase, partial [Myxococcota bacterium]